MIVPEQVRRDCVTAHRFRHPDAVTPVLFRYASGVHLSADDLERFPVKKKLFFAEGKSVFTVLGVSLSR